MLHSIRYKWRQIGQSLKICHRDLKNIHDEENRNVDRLFNVIRIWFEQPLSTLHEFLDHFRFYNDDISKIIFPINNLCWQNRKKISLYFCQSIISYKKHITVPIPVHCYMFKKCLKEDHYFEILSALIRFSFFDSLENILPKRRCLKTYVHCFCLEGEKPEVDFLFQICTLRDESGQYIVSFQVNKYDILFIMTKDNEVFKGKNTI